MENRGYTFHEGILSARKSARRKKADIFLCALYKAQTTTTINET
jgi:hypothetical protein